MVYRYEAPAPTVRMINRDEVGICSKKIKIINNLMNQSLWTRSRR